MIQKAVNKMQCWWPLCNQQASLSYRPLIFAFESKRKGAVELQEMKKFLMYTFSFSSMYLCAYLIQFS